MVLQNRIFFFLFSIYNQKLSRTLKKKNPENRRNHLALSATNLKQRSLSDTKSFLDSILYDTSCTIEQ